MQTLYQSDGAFNAKIGSSQAERGRGRVALRILLAEPDPYLSFLIHLEFPEAEVLESESDPDLAGQAELVIVDLDAPGALDVLDADYEGKLLGIGDGRRARDTALLHGLDGLLLRPFLPEELYRAIRQALNFPEVAIEA